MCGCVVRKVIKESEKGEMVSLRTELVRFGNTFLPTPPESSRAYKCLKFISDIPFFYSCSKCAFHSFLNFVYTLCCNLLCFPSLHPFFISHFLSSHFIQVKSIGFAFAALAVIASFLGPLLSERTGSYVGGGAIGHLLTPIYRTLSGVANSQPLMVTVKAGNKTEI